MPSRLGLPTDGVGPAAPAQDPSTLLTLLPILLGGGLGAALGGGAGLAAGVGGAGIGLERERQRGIELDEAERQRNFLSQLEAQRGRQAQELAVTTGEQTRETQAAGGTIQQSLLDIQGQIDAALSRQEAGQELTLEDRRALNSLKALREQLTSTEQIAGAEIESRERIAADQNKSAQAIANINARNQTFNTRLREAGADRRFSQQINQPQYVTDPATNMLVKVDSTTGRAEFVISDIPKGITEEEAAVAGRAMANHDRQQGAFMSEEEFHERAEQYKDELFRMSNSSSLEETELASGEGELGVGEEDFIEGLLRRIRESKNPLSSFQPPGVTEGGLVESPNQFAPGGVRRPR